MTYQPPPAAVASLQRAHLQEIEPSYVLPGDERAEEVRYILTLDTDQELYNDLTALRKKYFPPNLNKIPGHLTLFHALPGSRLESDIIPTIRNLVDRTQPFTLRAGLPFRMAKGIAVPVVKRYGGTQAQQLHGELREPWLNAGFLSPQDQQTAHLHWTIMNKVNDKREVDAAMAEVSNAWNGPYGTATGLRLWRYENDGHWTNQQLFPFKSADGLKDEQTQAS